MSRRPRQARAVATVARVLDAAAALLEREGVAGFNTNRIAATADISVGTLYEYFADKEAIAAAVAERLARTEQERVLAALQAADRRSLRVAIAPLVRATFAVYREHAALTAALTALHGLDRRRVGERHGERAVVAAIAARLRRDAGRATDAAARRDAWVVFHLVESMAYRAVAFRHRQCPPQALERATVALVRAYIYPAAAKG